MKITRRNFLFAGAGAATLGFCGLVGVGSVLTAPCLRSAGTMPGDLPGEAVTFPSASGSVLHGWFVSGSQGAPVIILMHGARGSRRDMLGRARLLHRAGYGVLLFDFQAHGESSGKHITFGWLESKDARAAVDFVSSKVPGVKIGIVGGSLGGAAAVLADPPLPVDAMVLEMVYPTIDQAIEDRLAMRLGKCGKLLAPLLSWQLRPRLGISPEQLRPIARVPVLSVPKLFIAGTEDRHTTFPEAEALFAAAASPKSFWPVPGAAHVDLRAFAPKEYEKRVLEFFRQYLGR